MESRTEEVLRYRAEHECSLKEAASAINRRMLLEELEAAGTIDQLKIIIKRIIQERY